MVEEAGGSLEAEPLIDTGVLEGPSAELSLLILSGSAFSSNECFCPFEIPLSCGGSEKPLEGCPCAPKVSGLGPLAGCIMASPATVGVPLAEIGPDGGCWLGIV